MTRYEGLDARLKTKVLDRDKWRCRWCGATNRGLDAHHIRYRRGFADDVIENLISLCRTCHGFVHGTPNGAKMTISKGEAQQVLNLLVERPGTTGSAMWRALKKRGALEGKCHHGVTKNACLDCRRS